MSLRDAKVRQTAALHTPTDLKPDAVRDISGALNILLADMFALYLKTKNFHWQILLQKSPMRDVSCPLGRT
jgi:starvation-inducible DNA-binding protein